MNRRDTTEVVLAGAARLKALMVTDLTDEFTIIANRIRARIRRTTVDIIETGNDLIAVKSRLDHGEFIVWIDREFQMTDRTARNYMLAAEWAADKSEIVFVLPPTTIYKLSAPSTPETIKAEVVADLKAGRPVDHRAIEAEIGDRRRIERHHASLNRRRRRRAKSLSPTAQKRQAARERKAEAAAIERRRVVEAAGNEAMAIFAKLPAADVERLRQLLDEFGAYVVIKRLGSA